jgi:phosphohistidine phosphatase
MIWLLRHGEAEPGSPDAERKLTDDGERQARAAGVALAKLEVPIDVCMTSPKLRAADTAKLACAELGIDMRLEPALAGGPFDAEQLAAGFDNALLVGHDPDFSMSVHSLTGAQVRLKKGGLAAVEHGELVVVMTPRELTAIAA